MDNIKSPWKPEWQFDYNIHLSTHIVSAVPGQSLEVPAIIELVRGEPQPIILNVSPDWVESGLIAQIIPSKIIPGGMAILHIVASANTPPGSYSFTVRGETQGTFKTSQDMITVVIKPAPKSQEKNSDQANNEASKIPSQSLPLTKARAVNSNQSNVKTRQSKGRVIRGFAAIVTVLVVVGGLLYISNNMFHKDIIPLALNSTSGTTTYIGTQTFTIYSTLGGAPETSSGPANVQIDSSGDVLGPVLFGKIANGVFTGQAQTSDGTVTPMTGTLTNGNFEASYQSSSHSWIWDLHEQ
jgi:hypothetical protein